MAAANVEIITIIIILIIWRESIFLNCLIFIWKIDLIYVRVTVKMASEESSGSGGRAYSEREVASAGFL